MGEDRKGGDEKTKKWENMTIGGNDEKSEVFDEYMDDLLKGMHKVIHRYISPRDFEPRNNDVFIVTWMKSGTTLMQNIYYQLMVESGGVVSDPDGRKFRDISTVVPFIEMSKICGVQYPIHPYEPIGWKSHSTAGEFSKQEYKSCKFLYLIREGKTVARSFLDFTADWVVENACPPELREQFYRRYFNEFFLNYKIRDDRSHWTLQDEAGEWFRHVRGWLDSKNDYVLIVPYEDIVKDLAGAVRMVATLVNIEVTDEIVAKIVGKCDRKAMANDSRFNDVMVSECNGLDVTGGRRVRDSGEKGFAQYTLPRECVDRYDKMFTDVFSFPDYQALVEHVRARNEQILDRVRNENRR